MVLLNINEGLILIMKSALNLINFFLSFSTLFFCFNYFKVFLFRYIFRHCHLNQNYIEFYNNAITGNLRLYSFGRYQQNVMSSTLGQLQN
jgi:hypothetical protein